MRQTVREEREVEQTSWPVEAGQGSDGAAQWRRVQARLASDLGKDVFASWFRALDLVSVDGTCVTLQARSKFIRDWIVDHYEDRLRAFWAFENSTIRSVRVVLAAHGSSLSRDTKTMRPGGAQSPATEEAGQRTASQTGGATRPSGASGHSAPVASGQTGGVGTPFDPRYTFETFIVGAANELASAAARRVVDTDRVAFNPLYLYGPVGVGKTHLLHAIAWGLRRKDPSLTVLYLSAERFMYQFVRALKDKDMLSFKDQLRRADVLVLDDVQFIANKDSTQEEFFHTFDALMGENRQVVLTANCPPSDLDGVDERIRSRLGQGLAVEIQPADYALRLKILISKARQMCDVARAEIAIPQTVLEFLAHRITANVRVLEGALNRLAAHAVYVGRPISVDMAKEILVDVLRASERKITIDDIQRCVTGYYHISHKELISSRRAREVARPRQIAMYLCKQLTTRSLPEIGRKFGKRDHTTVIYAVRRIEDLMSTDAQIARDVECLRRRLVV